jgi:hypothetical protein
MRRSFALFLIAGLVLAPAAAAKGPHAVLESDAQRVDAGRPWAATLTLMEFTARGADAAFPAVRARHEEAVVTARVTRLSSYVPTQPGVMAEMRYRVLLILPDKSSWRLSASVGKRRFVFPVVGVGSGRMPSDFVAFPEGSEAERAGAGGEWGEGAEPAEDGRGGVLPPEVTILAKDRQDGDGGISLWIPVLGLALAGAGVCTFRARR